MRKAQDLSCTKPGSCHGVLYHSHSVPDQLIRQMLVIALHHLVNRSRYTWYRYSVWNLQFLLTCVELSWIYSDTNTFLFGQKDARCE